MPPQMIGLGPMGGAEYLRVNERLRVSLGYSQDWAEQLMARRVLVELKEHLAAFQRRRGHAVVPLLSMSYYVRRMWSYEFVMDRAKTKEDDKIRRVARRAACVRAHVQRRAEGVRPGLWVRSRIRLRGRAKTAALPDTPD